MEKKVVNEVKGIKGMGYKFEVKEWGLQRM